MDHEHTITTVPRDESGRLELLSARPAAWEYLLFGYALRSGLAHVEPKWRDYQLGYTMEIGPAIPTSELGSALSDRISRSGAIAANLMKVVSPQAQESAFGKPGEPGDPELVEHMGGRLILLYEQLLDWAHELRSLRVEDKAEGLPELAVAYVAQPIAETRRFVHSYIEQVEALAASLAAGTEPVPIQIRLAFEISEPVKKAYIKQWRRTFGR